MASTQGSARCNSSIRSRRGRQNMKAPVRLLFLLVASLCCSTSLAWLQQIPTFSSRPISIRVHSSSTPEQQGESRQESNDDLSSSSTSAFEVANSALSRVDQLRSMERQSSRKQSKPTTSDLSLMDAAAAVTQQSCQLLGVKSIGVDYGLVKTGIAATVGYEPTPLGILVDLSSTELCEQIVQYCRNEQASQIVVGLPLHKNGTEATQTTITRVFADELAVLAMQQLGPGISVVMWDERYTSKFAAARAQSKSAPNQLQRLYGTLDADAACIILEHFYKKNGEGAHAVVVPRIKRGECIKVYEASRLKEETALLAASEERRNGSRSTKREEMMEKARLMEEEMAKQGTLGSSRKKNKKKKKKKREKRVWLSADGAATASATDGVASDGVASDASV